jgi:hypothetical protein
MKPAAGMDSQINIIRTSLISRHGDFRRCFLFCFCMDLGVLPAAFLDFDLAPAVFAVAAFFFAPPEFFPAEIVPAGFSPDGFFPGAFFRVGFLDLAMAVSMGLRRPD